MSKVYVVTGFFRAVNVNNERVRTLTSLTKTLKVFDTAAKAVEYITYENPLKLMQNFPMYNENWEGNWVVDSTDISEDQLTVWHRLVSKTGKPKHWLVILEIHEMEVE